MSWNDPKICDTCGDLYVPTGKRQKRCSKACSDQHFKVKYFDNGEYQRQYRLNNWAKKTIAFKRLKSERAGIPFDITPEDIPLPEFCPALGIKLEINHGGGSGNSSPSVDRINPNEGYVKGNVIVISNKANRIKSNATYEEIEKVAKWLKQLTL